MIHSWDERRDLAIGANTEETIAFAAENWIHQAQKSIQQRARFAVALAGGSTPKAIYQKVTASSAVDWEKVWLFWSDERSCPPDHPDSNYRMAMDSGFSRVPIPPQQIFRMKAERDIEKNAADYEELIRHHLGKHLFDLVMLGVGEDGHTASLFPDTQALAIEEQLVAANFVPKLKTHRMTLTFPCILESTKTAIYALGAPKQAILPQVLNAAIRSSWPASRLGTPEKKALWILDPDAAAHLQRK
ncbi:MAG: 6-phosphogluconolactonase [Chlamydiia bacterium]|nr:6-phosphogluconolactonase [Chlamydiia bacterium]